MWLLIELGIGSMGSLVNESLMNGVIGRMSH